MQNTERKYDEFEKMLRFSNFRITQTKRRIFEVLLTANKPLSINEVYKQLPETHLVSVYRSVDVLLKARIVKFIPQGFKRLYELSDSFKAHHHHAVCELCGISKEIKNTEIEKIMDDICVENGLKPTKHHFEIFGICQNCLN
jgi:Fe2+ or Zn2+ uptake regulation protein